MADAYQLEQSVDRYLLEDGTGVYLLEQQPEAPIVVTTQQTLTGVGR